MKRIGHFLELLMLNSRWLLAPFYVGLVVAIAMLLIKFLQEFLHIVPQLLTSTESEIVLAILTIVDMSLVANLLLIINLRSSSTSCWSLPGSCSRVWTGSPKAPTKARKKSSGVREPPERVRSSVFGKSPSGDRYGREEIRCQTSR